MKDRLHVCSKVLLLHFCIIFCTLINEMKVAVLNTGTCTLNLKKIFSNDNIYVRKEDDFS